MLALTVSKSKQFSLAGSGEIPSILGRPHPILPEFYHADRDRASLSEAEGDPKGSRECLRCHAASGNSHDKPFGAQAPSPAALIPAPSSKQRRSPYREMPSRAAAQGNRP